MAVPNEPHQGGDTCAAEQSDDLGGVPRKLVTSILQSEKQLDDCGGEEDEADQVEVVRQFGQDRKKWTLGRLLRDGKEDDSYRYKSTWWNIDIER